MVTLQAGGGSVKGGGVMCVIRGLNSGCGGGGVAVEGDDGCNIEVH